MNKVEHRFLDYELNPLTETLILGTFNPDTEDNNADFFYGRSRNYLWKILPTTFDELDLKKSTKSEKLTFIKKYQIDFIDLISEVNVESGQEANYDDIYLDDKVISWRNIIGELERLKRLKRIGFTRKTFSGIPNIKNQIELIHEYCIHRGIRFKSLVTPSRFYREDKQKEWSEFLLN